VDLQRSRPVARWRKMDRLPQTSETGYSTVQYATCTANNHRRHLGVAHIPWNPGPSSQWSGLIHPRSYITEPTPCWLPLSVPSNLSDGRGLKDPWVPFAASHPWRESFDDWRACPKTALRQVTSSELHAIMPARRGHSAVYWVLSRFHQSIPVPGPGRDWTRQGTFLPTRTRFTEPCSCAKFVVAHGWDFQEGPTTKGAYVKAIKPPDPDLELHPWWPWCPLGLSGLCTKLRYRLILAVITPLSASPPRQQETAAPVVRLCDELKSTAERSSVAPWAMIAEFPGRMSGKHRRAGKNSVHGQVRSSVTPTCTRRDLLCVLGCCYCLAQVVVPFLAASG